MNSLQTKIQEASNLFQTHDFKKALQLYDQCIGICRKNNQSRTLIQNLISSKCAVMSILGNQKGALQCVNEVLDYQPYHSLCLLRRSQIYKKSNKLNKALKDLKLLMRFSPDNLQIAALKVQIQNLKLKTKQTNSSQSQQQSNQSIDLDEQQQLNFSNLKNIDRKSVSIMYCGANNRKSRVTIAGDIAITYETPQNDDDINDKNSYASTNVSKEYLKQKFHQTFKQIQIDDDQQDLNSNQQSSNIQIFNIKIQPIQRKHKSILKNRDSTLYLNMKPIIQKQKKYGGRQSKIIDLLKNIDGKIIQGVQKERQRTSVSFNGRPSKQVQFRKSMFVGLMQNNNVELVSTLSENNKSKKTGPRKSCIKMTSNNNIQQSANKMPQPRRSKFERMSQVGIDGIVLKKQSNHDNQNSTKNNVKNDSDSDSDNSEHNIFGGKQFVISKQVRQNLGIGSESLQDTDKKYVAKPRTTGGKSILKKNSIMLKTTNNDKPSPLKAKKSVMFTRFDNKEQ